MGVFTRLLSEREAERPLHLRPSRSEPERAHVAAVCYRIRGGELQFLLVRTKNGHWTFPKGGVDRDATHAHAAAREAYEEAGVRGSVELAPFISYKHCKPRWMSSPSRVVVVHAHLCEVVQLVKPVEQYRDPQWFNAEKAKRRLQKFRTSEFASELVSVIDRATERLSHR
jgi:8-oxo-dGTP pyrophosphatase MutT (NUDIX family)